MVIGDVLKLGTPTEKVDGLKKGRLTNPPNISSIKKQWDPSLHDVQDPLIRKKKTVTYTIVDDNGKETNHTRLEEPTRISIALQKLIVKRAASFLFGNAVKIETDKDKSKLKEVVEKILTANKQKGLNKRSARTLFSCTEVAEYWYMVDAEEANRYGIAKNNSKIKVAIFDPMKGDLLYPFFDDYGDLLAFSREYKKKEGSEEVAYFQTWTAERYMKFKQGVGGWIVEKDTANPLGKIPIVYASQEQVEWGDVQWIIDRLEKLLSNYGDTNDYHHAPKWVVKGEVKGFSSKGESGSILEVDGENGEATLVSWNQAPEAVKLEIEKLFQIAYAITQTPDISFEAVKGLGNAASGNTLRMMFLDPHLKVQEHLEEYDPYLERRLSILMSFAGIMDESLKTEIETTELTPVVVPYMVDDIETILNNLNISTSSGILSRDSAVRLNPLVANPDEEIERLNKERQEAEASALALNEAQNQDPAGGDE